MSLDIGVKLAVVYATDNFTRAPPFMPTKTCVIASNSCMSLTYHFYIGFSVALSIRLINVDENKTLIDA